MEKPKGQGSDPKTGGSKTEQRRGSFKKKHPYRADKPATIDTLKERVNPHIPLLKPGSIGDLLTFKHRLSDHVRSHFTLNGNLFQSGSYYDGRETLSLLHAARASIVKINRRTAGTTTPQSSDASADEEDDEEDAQTEEGHDDQQSPDALVEELDRLVSSLPKKSRIKVLDAQLSQGARALLQNRLDSEAEKVKIFALLLSKISEASLALLRNAPEAETLLLEANDPLKLWSTIEMTHMGGSSNHDTQIYQILRAYQTARQDNLESIHTYYERFIQIVSTMDAPLDPPYLQARHFLQQLDRTKYGKFLTDLRNLVTSGALPSYPRSVAEAYNLAKERVEPTSAQGNNRFANPVVFSTIGDSPKEKKAAKKKDKKVVRTKGSNPPPGTCDLCGQTGHFIRSCPRLEDAKQAVSKDGGRFTAATFGFEGSESVFMAHSARTVKLRDTDILLDTQANISVFRNRELLTDVHDTADGVTISGFVQGNAERTSCIGSFLGVEPIYLAPNGAANTLSFNQLERGDHDISWARNSHFDVRFSGVNISLRFHVRANGLYVADGSKFAKEMGQVMVTTVAQREAAYPPDQLKRAKEARRLQERLGHVSTDALVRSLNHGVLINAPVTAADVLRAHDIYGPSEQLLHGTKKRDKQKPMGILEFVPRPVQTELILLADIMQVENDTYLISVSYPLRLT